MQCHDDVGAGEGSDHLLLDDLTVYVPPQHEPEMMLNMGFLITRGQVWVKEHFSTSFI